MLPKAFDLLIWIFFLLFVPSFDDSIASGLLCFHLPKIKTISCLSKPQQVLCNSIRFQTVRNRVGLKSQSKTNNLLHTLWLFSSFFLFDSHLNFSLFLWVNCSMWVLNIFSFSSLSNSSANSHRWSFLKTCNNKHENQKLLQLQPLQPQHLTYPLGLSPAEVRIAHQVCKKRIEMLNRLVPLVVLPLLISVPQVSGQRSLDFLLPLSQTSFDSGLFLPVLLLLLSVLLRVACLVIVGLLNKSTHAELLESIGNCPKSFSFHFWAKKIFHYFSIV